MGLKGDRHVAPDWVEPERAVAMRDAPRHQRRPARLADRHRNMTIDEPMGALRECVEARRRTERVAVPPAGVGIHVISCDNKQIQLLSRIRSKRAGGGNRKNESDDDALHAKLCCELIRDSPFNLSLEPIPARNAGHIINASPPLVTSAE